MDPYDREHIRYIIVKKMSPRIKKYILDMHIEGLIDEYIEKLEFIRKNGLTFDDYPTKKDMKWWFQDKFDPDNLKDIKKDAEIPLEIQVDDICLNDKLATEVFKTFYKFKWKQDDVLPDTAKQLIKLMKMEEAAKTPRSKEKIRYRLNNIAVVGTIRFYHLERKPYLTTTQIEKAINYFKNALLLINKIDSGDFEGQDIQGELALFDTLKDRTKKK